MITQISEFKVPIIVSVIGLALVTVLANPTDDSENTDYAQLLQNNSDAITQLGLKLEEYSSSLAVQTSALESRIDSVSSRMENESVIINKAMGRISQRIALQSKKAKEIQLSISELGAASSNLDNHTKTLDSAVVQQHSRHNKLRSAIAYQQTELQRLLELNARLGEIFSSFGGSQ